jgi:hypothetical protein
MSLVSYCESRLNLYFLIYLNMFNNMLHFCFFAIINWTFWYFFFVKFRILLIVRLVGCWQNVKNWTKFYVKFFLLFFFNNISIFLFQIFIFIFMFIFFRILIFSLIKVTNFAFRFNISKIIDILVHS